MAELKPCPFDNYMCMCQFCEDKCNKGLHCSDCEYIIIKKSPKWCPLRASNREEIQYEE